MECQTITNLDDQALEPLFRTFDAWHDAVVDGDLDAIADLVTEDAEFWTQAQPALRGRDTLRAAMAPLLEEWTLDQEFACDELIVSGDLAVARGTEINRLTPRGGGENLVRRQRAFSVLRRSADGVWRFARGMTTPAPDETAAAAPDSGG